MNVKRVKRKCSVRGCKCTEAYAISLVGEVGNTVIICKSCLEEGAMAVSDYKVGIRTVKKKKGIPPLFFNSKKAVSKPQTIPQSASFTQEGSGESKESGIIDNEDHKESGLITEDYQSKSDAEIKCPGCGKAFESEKGLKSHLRYCDKA